MNGRVALYSAILVAIAILQTTVLQAIEIAGIRPDLSLIVIAYFANQNGTFESEIGAFIGGLVEDFLSMAPPGFHALVRTVVAFLYGLTQNKMLVDSVLVPFLLLIAGTLVKALLASLTGTVFGVAPVASSVFSSRLFVEVGYNAVLAPILFGLLRLVKPLRQTRRESSV